MYKMRFINATAGIRRMSKVKLVFAVILIIALCTSSAVAASEMNITSVYCDNVEYKVFSLSADPYEIVEKAGVAIDGENELVLDYFDPSLGGSVIIVAEPHNVTIYDGKKFVATVNVAGTVQSALNKAGVTLNDGDKTNLDPGVGITSDLTVEITRAFPVTLTVDGDDKVLNVTGGTVEQLLQKAGISLGENDTVSKKLTKQIKKKTTIEIDRVEYKIETETVRIDYDTKVEYDDSMYEDQKKVKVKGVKGKNRNECENTYVNGKLTDSKILSTEVIKEPVTQVIVRGTKVRTYGFTGATVKSGRVISEMKPPFEITLNKNGRPVNYKKVITGKATAYCGGGITSTGAPAKPGRVAVDPREIPYGTKMYIVSSDGRWNYGYCIASDTGGFIYNSSTVVDLYMHSYRDCMTFGRRNVDIYILEWGNGIKNWKTH